MHTLCFKTFCSIDVKEIYFRDNVYDCTSSNFEGMIASCKPEDSWVCKWQRISKFTKGVGLKHDDGRLDDGVAGVRHLCAGQAAPVHSEGAEECWHHLQEQGHQQDLSKWRDFFVIC